MRSHALFLAFLALGLLPNVALADQEHEGFDGGEFTNPFFIHDIEFDDPCCRGFEFRDEFDGFALHLRPNTDFITFDLPKGMQVESVSVTMLDFEGGFRGDQPTSFIAFRSADGDFVGFNADELGVPFTASADRNTPGQITGEPLGDIVTIQLQAANEGNSAFPTEFGAYFDNIIVELGPADSVDLTSVEVTTGTILNGDLSDLRASDDSFLHTRSGFGQTFVDLHNMTMEVAASTDVQAPTTLDVSVEGHVDEPSGNARLRLRNWTTGEHDNIASGSIGMNDSVITAEGIDAAMYVDGDGRIELEIRHTVFVPFVAFTFESFVDRVAIDVQ